MMWPAFLVLTPVFLQTSHFVFVWGRGLQVTECSGEEPYRLVVQAVEIDGFLYPRVRLAVSPEFFVSP